jgi:hypothetical protein
MSELHPCPECQRHIRKTESTCPFCGESVSLGHLPAHVLPRKRMGRAATFAFGATVVGATAIVSCSDGSDVDNGVAVYGAPPAAGAGGSFGGSAVYGAPPSGSGGTSVGDGGTNNAALYGGAPPGGEAGVGNESSVGGVYGSPPEGGQGGVTTNSGGSPAGAGGQ